MPLSQYERSVALFSWHLEMVPQDAEPAPPVTMEVAFQMIVDAFTAGEATMRVGEFVEDYDDDEVLEISGRHRANVLSIEAADWDVDGFLTLLLHHSDTLAADPALKNIPTGQTRMAGKTASDGLAYAAHLVVSIDRHVTAMGQYRALLERVPGVGRSAMTNLLNRVLRRQARKQNMEYKDPRTRRMKRCYPRLISQYRMSSSLQDDLRAGRLQSVEFVSRNVVGGFEEADRVVPVARVLSYKVVQAPAGAQLPEFLARLKLWGRTHEFEEMELKFLQNGTKRQLSSRISTEAEIAEEAIYARLALLSDFEHALTQCPTEIVEEIKIKMRAILEQEGLWT